MTAKYRTLRSPMLQIPASAESSQPTRDKTPRGRWRRSTVLALLAATLLLGSLAISVAAKPETKAPVAVPDNRIPSGGDIWARAKQEVYKTPDQLTAQNDQEIRQGLRHAKLMQGDPRVPAIALTFDDGPHPKYTTKILTILRRYNIKATFFVVGEMARQYPGLVRAELADGHVVGNHTYHHVNLTKIPIEQVATEWQACQETIQSITGKTMRYDRPPGGDYNGDVIKAAMGRGLTTVLWTDDPGDYASPGDRIIQSRTLGRVRNGGIILLHDGVQETLDVLPKIIETLQQRGYRFETVEQMDTRRQPPTQREARR